MPLLVLHNALAPSLFRQIVGYQAIRSEYGGITYLDWCGNLFCKFCELFSESLEQLPPQTVGIDGAFIRIRVRCRLKLWVLTSLGIELSNCRKTRIDRRGTECHQVERKKEREIEWMGYKINS